MADKFQNKYRIPSARLPNWDYGWAAAYFITICTKDRECFFGEIVNGEMNLSKVGVIADVLWYEIKNHAKNIELGEFVVMPNHIHGIIVLNENDGTNGADPDVTVETTHSNVETTHALSLPSEPLKQSPQLEQPQPSDPSEQSEPLKQPEHPEQPEITEPSKTIAQQRFQNQGKNTISSIVGGYKSAITKHANRLKLDFAWQSRFHDHIIRDEQSFQTISNYILNNPKNWSDDKFFK